LIEQSIHFVPIRKLARRVPMSSNASVVRVLPT
jgi:hypothetical protein